MALSKIPDLTHSYKDQDYTFVGQLEDYLKELECPICRSIVSEPLQTSCGHLFCTECYNKLGGINRPQMGGGRTLWGVQCPVCNQGHTVVQDNFNDRKVKNLQVRCTNRQYGCKWVGNLGDEMQHRMTENGCHFEVILCPYGCDQTIRRTTQSRHLKECQMRPHKCKYCGEEGPYGEIANKVHQKRCRRYPVRCPNGCNERIPREETASYKLKKAVSSLETKLQAEEQRVRDLEEENKARTDHIRQLIRDNRANAEHILELERDAEDRTECICELESDVKAKVIQIHELERIITTKAQCVNQLTTENSEKQKKLKHIKMFIVFALGTIVLFRLHPLYFIPLLILYSAAYV